MDVKSHTLQKALKRICSTRGVHYTWSFGAPFVPRNPKHFRESDLAHLIYVYRRNEPELTARSVFEILRHIQAGNAGFSLN
jgi:hypothetical protein